MKTSSAAKSERRLSFGESDLRRDGPQGEGCADCRPSRRYPRTGRFDRGCAKTRAFNLRVESSSHLVNLKTKIADDGYPKEVIEKTILRFLGSRTFSHGLDSKRLSVLVSHTTGGASRSRR
jgi:hypothetical protein